MSSTNSAAKSEDGYVQRRAALIPRAEAIANNVAGASPPDGATKGTSEYQRWTEAWDRAFLMAIDQLSAEAEAKRRNVEDKAENEVQSVMKRWRRGGLTLGEAAQVLERAKGGLR